MNGWACLLKQQKTENARNVLSRFFKDLEFPFKVRESILHYNEKGNYTFFLMILRY